MLVKQMTKRGKEMAHKTSIREGTEDFSLREIVAPIFRRRNLLLVTLLCAFVSFSAIGLLLLYKFKSEMAVLVTRKRVDPMVTTGVPNQTITQDVPMTEEEINSEAELLQSWDLLEAVVRANKLQDHDPSFLDAIFPKEDESHRVANAVKTLARKLKIRPSTKANIIDVSYSTHDPQVSYSVLNTLGNLYLEKHASVHRPAGSYDFFSNETQKYKQALDESETRIRNFMKTSGAASPDLQGTDLDLQVANSIGQLHITQQLIAADEKRILSDQEQMKTTPQRSTRQLASSPADLLLQQLGASLLAAETKRSQLLLKYDSNYPLVKEAERELAETKAAFQTAEQTKYVTENTDADPTYELLREDLAKTQAGRGSAAGQFGGKSVKHREHASTDHPARRQGLGSVRSHARTEANEDNYLLYLEKREQERTSDALNKTRIENVAIAIPASMPVLPVMTPFVIIVLALVSATIASLVLVFTADYFDSSLHTPSQVMETLGIPVVIAISKRTA